MPSIETLLLVMAIVIPLGFMFLYGQVAISSSFLIQLAVMTLPIG